jgi:putative phosphonate metabolism protein
MVRYAIYFSPPQDSDLTKAASRWLGRDAFGAAVAAVEPGYQTLVADPSRYGFHGTLKAPFHLADDRSEIELLDAFDRVSGQLPPFEIDELVLGQLGPFFALVPGKGHHEKISSLAAVCVREFEPFRAPLSDGDIARRKPDALPERQRQYLLEWGYPYVFEEFRFHMTLTGPVARDEQDAVRATLEDRFAAYIGKPLKIRHLALFIEPERGGPFSVQKIMPLDGSIQDQKLGKTD